MDRPRCSECGKIFSSSDMLERHSNLVHDMPPEPEKPGGFMLPEVDFSKKELAVFMTGFLVTASVIGGYTVMDGEDRAVGITVVSCENCSYSKFRETTGELFPTEYREVGYRSEEGQRLIQKYELNYIPGFIFDREVRDAENFTRIRSVLVEFDDAYVLPDRGIEAAQRVSDGIQLN